MVLSSYSQTTFFLSFIFPCRTEHLLLYYITFMIYRCFSPFLAPVNVNSVRAGNFLAVVFIEHLRMLLDEWLGNLSRFLRVFFFKTLSFNYI